LLNAWAGNLPARLAIARGTLDATLPGQPEIADNCRHV
jgi:hypothetical protein